MRSFIAAGRILSASTFAALIAGCGSAGSGGSTPSVSTSGVSTPGTLQALATNRTERPLIPIALGEPLAQTPPLLSQLTIGMGPDILGPKGTVYVTQFNPGSVNDYSLPNKKNKPPVCLISNLTFVNGIGINASGTLYVPQQTNPGTITTYAPNCGAQGPTLSDPSGVPIDVAFNNNNGTVYVSDVINAVQSGPGYLSVYSNGATSPTQTLSDPSISQSIGVEVDAKGNVFEAYVTASGGPGVLEYPHGRMPAVLLGITGLTHATGLEIDKAGNLIVIDSKAISAFVYAPPYSGAPKTTIPLKGSGTFAKLDRPNANLYVSDKQNGSLDVFAYPSGTYEYSITNGLTQSSIVEGVAVAP